MYEKGQFLGIDKRNKPWYVYTIQNDDFLSFCVSSKKSIDTEIDYPSYIVVAHVQKISKDRVILLDIRHTRHEKTSSRESKELPQDVLYEILSTEESALDVDIQENEPVVSLFDSGVSNDNKSIEKIRDNWENRGIGKLLLEQIEIWAYRTKIRTIIGYISKYDDVKKLTIIYKKWGWQVKSCEKSKKSSHGYRIGVIMKKRDKFTLVANH